MAPDAVLGAIIRPALALLPARMDSEPARIQLLATGLQESGFTARRQAGNGPARGFWQFEKGGGVRGVLLHASTFALAQSVCKARGVEAAPAPVWNALEKDDILAAAFARLLLWTDPSPLPATAAAGWALYARTWRPGRPHPERWPANFETAKVTVMG